MSALSPSTYVTEVPGRYTPTYVVDKRTPGSITTTGAAASQMAFLPRCETIDSTFNTPTTAIDEIGTNFHVGEYDDLPESKLTLSCYDVGTTIVSLITGKAAAGSGTTTWGFADFNAAKVDVIRQFADPNGEVFASMYQGDMVIEEFGFSLKNKSVAMESYSLMGFNMMKFKGYIVTKAYVIQSADASTPIDTSFYGFAMASHLGTTAVVELPNPTGAGVPASYWNQNGCYAFLKVEKYRSGLGWIRFPEQPPSTSGQPPAGMCRFNAATHSLYFAQSDLVAGDIVLYTYCTYTSDINVGGNSISTINQTSPDTSDAIAVPTRLTPFTISANEIERGQSLDCKMSLKRDRAEGIGDTTGLLGPSDAPEVSVSLEVKVTDFGFNAILQNGSPLGSDDGGSAAGDFYDPNWATRNQLVNAVALVATIEDPRNAGSVLKTYTCPTMVLNNDNTTAATKNAATVKLSGTDRTGNLSVSVTH